MAVRSAINFPCSQIFVNSSIYSLVPSSVYSFVEHLEHLLYPGTILVTQDNYELLSLILFPYGLESGHEISEKLNNLYILLYFPPFLFLLLLFSFFLFPSQLLLSLPVSGLEETRRWEFGVKDWFKELFSHPGFDSLHNI